MKSFELVARKELGNLLVDWSVVRRRGEGRSGREKAEVWFRVDRRGFRRAVELLCSEFEFPHLSTISYVNLADGGLELVYNFAVDYGLGKNKECVFNLRVRLPEGDLRIESICDLIPGALTAEREKQEFLGVKFSGIPDDRRLFLPDSVPRNVFPWRAGSKVKTRDITNEEGVGK